MIKGSANCVTDRRRRMALDGVTCILISFESRGLEWEGRAGGGSCGGGGGGGGSF